VWLLYAVLALDQGLDRVHLLQARQRWPSYQEFPFWAALAAQEPQEHLPVTSAECLTSSRRPLADRKLLAECLMQAASLLLAGPAPAVPWMELLPAQ
jgi:hypothetical protein